MLIKMIFSGIVIGMIASVMTLISGLSVWLALAAYLVFGSLGTALSSITILIGTLRSEKALQKRPSALSAPISLGS